MLKDRCPLCHEILHLVEEDSEGWQDGDMDGDEGFDDVDAGVGMGGVVMPAQPQVAEEEWYMPDANGYIPDQVH
jgi:hypothetical protein